MDADVALLQEVHPGGYEWLRNAKDGVAVSPQEPWELWNWYDRWPLVVKLSNRVKVEWFRQTIPTRWVEADEIAVSGVGTVAAAKVIPMDDGEPFIAVSMYARWYEPKPTDGTGWFYPDASAHRIISDLTVFIDSPVFSGYEDNPNHRILAAGDLNMDFDFGRGTDEGALRANTVFDRMNALGLEYLGPQHPNGRRADPTPEHLPEDTRNVVTYYPGKSPETARLQLDHVFASRGFHHSVHTRAFNDVDKWGSSDHCRILIGIED
jgi:hypothetical protein